MAMPAAPIQPVAGLPSLTSSELYIQALAAQADVLVAAKAWPLLAKSFADLTDIPGRQQLAILLLSGPFTRNKLTYPHLVAKLFADNKNSR